MVWRWCPPKFTSWKAEPQCGDAKVGALFRAGPGGGHCCSWKGFMQLPQVVLSRGCYHAFESIQLWAKWTSLCECIWVCACACVCVWLRIEPRGFTWDIFSMFFIIFYFEPWSCMGIFYNAKRGRWLEFLAVVERNTICMKENRVYDIQSLL